MRELNTIPPPDPTPPAVEPTDAPIPSAAGWGTPQTNIKGPAGGVPDPLNVNTINCGTVIYIGTKARFTGLTNGVKLEVQDSTGVWRIQAQWTQ
jgi:hypothetical protein